MPISRSLKSNWLANELQGGELAQKTSRTPLVFLVFLMGFLRLAQRRKLDASNKYRIETLAIQKRTSFPMPGLKPHPPCSEI